MYGHLSFGRGTEMTVFELMQKLAKMPQNATVIFEPRDDPLSYSEVCTVEEQKQYLEVSGMFDPDAPIDDFDAVVLS